MSQTYFATINPGLEDALLEEIRELGGRKARKLAGGVEFDASNTSLYDILLRVRCANRIVLRVDEFRARDFPELYQKLERIDWTRIVGSAPVEVRATARESRLIHTGRIEETFRDALSAARPGVEPAGPPLTVLIRLFDDRCEVSLDAAGELLYMRGWRASSVAAPLRESTAAALLRLTEWSPGKPLIDPCCGSGTFVIEAAQRTLGLAAGADRKFALEHWGHLRPEVWSEARAAARAEAKPCEGEHRGYDIDEDAVIAARQNARQAGVEACTSFEERAISELEPGPEPGWLVANPPYGVRLEKGTVYADLLDVFEERFEGWTLAMLAPRDVSLEVAGLRCARLTKFSNGGIDVTWWKFTHRA